MCYVFPKVPEGGSDTVRRVEFRSTVEMEGTPLLFYEQQNKDKSVKAVFAIVFDAHFKFPDLRSRLQGDLDA